MPPLLGMYLRYGAKIVGDPAIDREFKTIDYLILLDISQFSEETFKLFLGKQE
jgi:putative hemolysin